MTKYFCIISCLLYIYIYIYIYLTRKWYQLSRYVYWFICAALTRFNYFSPDGGRRGGDMKHCGVCGDVAKSMHFGGLSCDSCKAFFRRSVQNNAYKAFACPYERKCTIAKTSRKACQYCRYVHNMFISIAYIMLMQLFHFCYNLLNNFTIYCCKS